MTAVAKMKLAAMVAAWVVLWPSLYSIVAYAEPAAAPQTAPSPDVQGPLRVFDGEVPRRERVPGDLQELRLALQTLVAAQDVSVSYTRMSDFRRGELEKAIRYSVGIFPKDAYDTPLQRRCVIENLRRDLRMILHAPVFPATNAEKTLAQAQDLADLVIRHIEQGLPDLATSDVLNEMKRLLDERWQDELRDDMTPALKEPLSDDEYAELLKTIDTELSQIRSSGRLMRAVAAVVPAWEQLGPDQRKAALKQHEEDAARHLLSACLPTLVRISDASEAVTKRSHPHEVEVLDALRKQAPSPQTRQLMDDALAERREIAKRSRTR